MDCVGVATAAAAATAGDDEVGVLTVGGGGACRVGRLTGRVQQFKLVKFNVVGGASLRCILGITGAVICSLSVEFGSFVAAVVVVFFLFG